MGPEKGPETIAEAIASETMAGIRPFPEKGHPLTTTASLALAAAPTVADSEPRARGVAYLTALDGMRGLAAYIVLNYHVVVFFTLSWAQAWFAPHAYLAVDCFFVMSGFVMAHAFDDKLKAGMTLRDFALHRLLRLYPLILAGVAFGAVSVIGFCLVTPGVPKLAVVEAIASGAVLLPTDALARFKPYDFPVNIVFWSLAYEVILCLGYAVIARFLTGWRMIAALVVAASGVLYLATSKQGMDIGFRLGDFGPGFGRVVYPFLMGIFLRRLPAFTPQRNAWGYLAIPLIGLVLVNPIPASGLYDAVASLTVIPFLVWLAATARGMAPFDRLAAWAGTLSYPVYALHFPIVVILANLGKKLALDEEKTIGLALVCIVVSLGLAWLTYVVYDKPVRAWLRKRLPFSSPKWA